MPTPHGFETNDEVRKRKKEAEDARRTAMIEGARQLDRRVPIRDILAEYAEAREMKVEGIYFTEWDTHKAFWSSLRSDELMPFWTLKVHRHLSDELLFVGFTIDKTGRERLCVYNGLFLQQVEDLAHVLHNETGLPVQVFKIHFGRETGSIVCSWSTDYHVDRI